MAYRILGDAGVSTWLAFGAMRSLRRSTSNAKTGTHELLARGARYTACLCVAVLHALLLRGELGAHWQCPSGRQSNDDQVFSHDLLSQSWPGRPGRYRRFDADPAVAFVDQIKDLISHLVSLDPVSRVATRSSESGFGKLRDRPSIMSWSVRAFRSEDSIVISEAMPGPDAQHNQP